MSIFFFKLSIQNKPIEENDISPNERPEYSLTMSLFLIISVFSPINLSYCLIILEQLEKFRLEKKYQAQDPDFLVNQPSCLTALTQINHAFLTQSSLIDNANIKITGAIIKENYYSIDEEKLADLKPILQMTHFSNSTPKERTDFKLQLERIEIKEESSKIFIF